MYYFYVYVTRHGVNSETSCLHVGYSSSNENSYPTWFSEGIADKAIVEKIYQAVKHYNHYSAGSRRDAIETIEELIEDYKAK